MKATSAVDEGRTRRPASVVGRAGFTGADTVGRAADNAAMTEPSTRLGPSGSRGMYPFAAAGAATDAATDLPGRLLIARFSTSSVNCTRPEVVVGAPPGAEIAAVAAAFREFVIIAALIAARTNIVRSVCNKRRANDYFLPVFRLRFPFFLFFATAPIVAKHRYSDCLAVTTSPITMSRRFATHATTTACCRP